MAGITRSTAIELCKEVGISVVEKHFTLKELKQSDSAFFTGTAAEVVGLKSLDEYQFPLQWGESEGNKL
ncbi:aminotransferase class IV, partial [Tenacibaculum halocynthiae]|uniref:aminotransferase class IV n=1 Tax=Tenacibaculum halocynthiae TaxID=1254437 RepID=UPI003D64D2D8